MQRRTRGSASLPATRAVYHPDSLPRQDQRGRNADCDRRNHEKAADRECERFCHESGGGSRTSAPRSEDNQ